MTTTATVLVDELAVLGIGQQEAVGVFHERPLVDALAQHRHVAALAQSLAHVAAVVEHDAIVGVTLEGPLVFVAEELFGGGAGVALVAGGGVDELLARAQGEVVPVGIADVG